MKELINILFWKLRAHNYITHKKLILQFIKFGLVGVSNTLVAWAVYYLFLYFDENLYMIGSITGTILSIANAFWGTISLCLPAVKMTG